MRVPSSLVTTVATFACLPLRRVIVTGADSRLKFTNTVLPSVDRRYCVGNRGGAYFLGDNVDAFSVASATSEEHEELVYPAYAYVFPFQTLFFSVSCFVLKI